MDHLTSNYPVGSELDTDGSFRVALIDPDESRRAAISFWLSGADLNVQPFDSVKEFFAYPRPSGLVLVADEADLPATLLAHPIAADYCVPFIAYSAKVDVHEVVQAMRNGAIDYLEWPAGKSDMASAVRAARARWQTLDWPRRQTRPVASQPHALTKRELEVLCSLREGMTSRQAAEKLGISVRTVDIYCGNIRRKYGVRRIADAIAMFNAAEKGQPLADKGEANGDRSRGLAGESWGAPRMGGDSKADAQDGMERKAVAQSRLARLTKREAEVLTHVANGLSNWQIADRLKISRRTVETHRYNLLDKMEMKNMALAIRLAAEGGLV